MFRGGKGSVQGSVPSHRLDEDISMKRLGGTIMEGKRDNLIPNNTVSVAFQEHRTGDPRGPQLHTEGEVGVPG